MTMPTQARSAGPAPGVPAAARALGSRRYGYAEALPRASPARKPHCGGAGPAPRVGGQRRRPLSTGLAALWHEDSRGRAWRATPGRPPGPRAPTEWTGRRAPGSSPLPAEPATSQSTSNRPRHGPGDTDTPPRAERMSLEDEAANTLPRTDPVHRPTASRTSETALERLPRRGLPWTRPGNLTHQTRSRAGDERGRPRCC